MLVMILKVITSIANVREVVNVQITPDQLVSYPDSENRPFPQLRDAEGP